jgi:hypothetical protein
MHRGRAGRNALKRMRTRRASATIRSGKDRRASINRSCVLETLPRQRKQSEVMEDAYSIISTTENKVKVFATIQAGINGVFLDCEIRKTAKKAEKPANLTTENN